ncbi:MAG TPA: helix-turn-helix domain-containing protein [Thermoanaerobaculia bacterium]|nr:helix-turn-helix domain-containing protein [Thermoanaerobaculia bacterium]
MPTKDLEVGTIIAILRTRRRWTQRRLAGAARIRRSALSDYEQGKVVPELQTLERIVTALGYSLAAIDKTREFLRSLDDEAALSNLPWTPGGAPSRLPEDLDALAVEWGRASAVYFRKAVGLLQAHPAGPTAPAAPVEAEVLVERLLALPVPKRRDHLQTHPEFRDLKVAVLLANRSLAVASNDPKLAVELTELGLAVARRLDADSACGAKVQWYLWGHLGNARKALGTLVEADAAFDAADEFLPTGASFKSDLLEEARIPAFRSSLRLAQGRLSESRELLDQALAMGPSSALAAGILINKARVLEEQGDLPGTIAALHEAETQLDRDKDPRLYLCARENLLDALSKADRFEEAVCLLPEVQRLTERHASRLDRARLRWIEGRIAAGLGEVSRGITLLTKARAELTSGEIGVETALVSLELAGLYAREGNTAAVKALAGHMAPIFQANVLHREALAALAYFRQAADREEVTEELTGKILTYLTRTRHNPGLRFKA